MMEKDFVAIFRLAREIDEYRRILIGHEWANEEDRPTILKIKQRVNDLHEQLKLI